MAINTINIGAVANDGTGDPIRTAFDTVNENFQFVQGGLFAGTESSIISAVSVTGGYLISNSYVLATSYVSAASIVGGTVTSNGNLYVSQNGAYIVGNVNIIGNLTVSGSQAASQSQTSSSSILNLHYSATPFIIDDSRDIGLEWQYYKASEQKAFLGWQNTTRSLVYLDNITESAGNVITAGTFGNVQFGQLLLSNTTVAANTTTGALQVKGGVGIAGNLFALGANVANLSVTGYHVGNLNFAGGDTVFINGSPVQTAATAFNGGTVGLATTFACTSPSTSTTTGAVIITGGLGVDGNVFLSNLTVPNSGNVRANIQGNIFTPAQPFITSLGTLSSLAMSGTITAFNINPNNNITYSLGSSTANRWNKIWTFDMDLSGTLTGGAINSTGGTHTGNIAINTATAAALTSTTAVGELFESGPTTIRIGGGGITQFRNNTKATSTSTGAVILTGGMAISTGANLYIGGSAGNAIVATGQIWTNGVLDTASNTQAISTTTGALQVSGGASLAQGNLYIGGSGGVAIVATGNIIPSSNNSVNNNIGSDTAWWNTFYGVSTQARYADLAEKYVADGEYLPGTVVVFGGDQEITVTETFADVRVAGVVSTNPAYLMNAAVEGVSVALRGRVPVQVLGAVSKGDLLVTSAQAGYAQSVGQSNSYGHAVFAKSLTTDGSNGSKIIEAVII
jgi:hypothetical protein